MSVRAIAEQQRVGRQQIRLVLARFQKNKPLGRRKGSGPKRKTTPGQDSKLIMDIKRDPRITITEILKVNPDVQVCAETIRTRLWETFLPILPQSCFFIHPSIITIFMILNT